MGGWMDNWEEQTRGPEYLRGISRLPDYPDGQDFSDAFIDPDLEAVGRFVRSCSMLEIALFQALTILDPMVTFAEAEWQFRPAGCIRWLRSAATKLTPSARSELERLLDIAEDYLDLRNGVVHGRQGRKAMGGVYESHRWVKEKGKAARKVKVEYDRDRLLLASVRAGNVAADILDCLEEWGRQMDDVRRQRRKQLGPGHPMRFEEPTDEATILHALSIDDPARTLCGADASAMDNYMVPDETGAPRHELMFEDSNPRNHCKKCRTASGL